MSLEGERVYQDGRIGALPRYGKAGGAVSGSSSPALAREVEDDGFVTYHVSDASREGGDCSNAMDWVAAPPYRLGEKVRAPRPTTGSVVRRGGPPQIVADFFAHIIWLCRAWRRLDVDVWWRAGHYAFGVIVTAAAVEVAVGPVILRFWRSEGEA